jgi:hypothetical protein
MNQGVEKASRRLLIFQITSDFILQRVERNRAVLAPLDSVIALQRGLSQIASDHLKPSSSVMMENFP